MQAKLVPAVLGDLHEVRVPAISPRVEGGGYCVPKGALRHLRTSFQAPNVPKNNKAFLADRVSDTR